MTLQQITDSAVKEFDEKFTYRVSNTNGDGYSVLIDEKDELPMSREQFISILISSIKKAVEVAYKEIEVEKEIPQPTDWLERTNEQRRAYLQGVRQTVSLIEKKKSEFIKK